MILAKIQNLTHRYDSRTTAVIKDISFELEKASVTTLIGPSGSGKTTTLKIINKEIAAQRGDILFQEEASLAYVNQFPILEDEKTILETLKDELTHLEFNDQKENQARSVVARLGLTNEINSQIKNISGGQRQRVVIAKALVMNPTLLLLDEPFANLDKTLRLEILTELFSLFKEEGISVLWVTHNTQEALSYSDKLILLNHGELIAQGSPHELYLKPPNLFCANFFGETNLCATKVSKESNKSIWLTLEGCEFEINKNDSKIREHKDILLVIHPEFINLREKGEFKAKVSEIIFKGSHNLIKVQTKTKSYYALSPIYIEIKKGQIINFDIKFDCIHYLTEI